MKYSSHRLALLVLLPVAAVALTSCKSNQGVVADDVVTTMAMPGGAAVVDTVKVFATVTSVDAATRKVTVKMSDGTLRTVKCGPGVVNFGQVHVNDMVTLTITEEFAIYLSGAGTPGASAGASVALSPVGYEPGGVVADTAQVTAQIVGINYASRVVTMQFPDGAVHAIKAGPAVDLSNLAAGQSVTARYTESVALNVSRF